MGSLGTLFAATLVAVTYGWMPASSDDRREPTSASDGYEYLVQIGAEDLRALAEGRVSSLSSATPQAMKSIDRVRIVFGEGDLPRQLTAVDRTSPRRISQSAVKHKVAKPIVSDWLPARSDKTGEISNKRHTVYQRPGYQNPGSLGEAMQRGFQEGTRQLTDAVRNAPQNVGNYASQAGRDANQAGRDLAQGTQDLVGGALNGLRGANDPYSNQRQQGANLPNGTAAGARQPGYKPFSYNNQPTLAGQANSQDSHAGHNHAGHDHSGHDHAGHDHAGHDHSPNTSLERQPVENRNQGPALPSGRSNADSSIATPFGSGANTDQDFRRNEGRQGRDDYPNYNQRDNDDYRDQYVDRRDGGRMTPVARDTTRQGPLDEFGTRRDDPYRPYRNSPRSGDFDDWGSQTVDNRRPAAPASRVPSSRNPNDRNQNDWDTPPFSPQQPVTQTAGFGAPGTNPGTSPDVRSWGDVGNTNPFPQQNGVNPNNSVNNGVNNGGQQNASISSPANDLLFFLLLAGSLAGNLYVVTSYLDVRNKYRSALRQGSGGYRHAA